MAKKRPSVAAQVFNKPFNCEVKFKDGKSVILHSDRPLSESEATSVVTSMMKLGHLRFGKSAVLELEVPVEFLRQIGL